LQGFSKQRWDDAKMLRISRWIALPTMGSAVLFAYIRPEPGILLILAFDIVLAGCFVPLLLGLFWPRANTAGAIASIAAGTLGRIFLQWVMPERLTGLETLGAPMISLVAFIAVALATQKRFPPRPEALTQIPTEEELVSG
jgi:SSS family solute:Na+ symporter